MKKEPIIVNVYLWGTCIGKLNWDFEKHCSVFQFTDEPCNRSQISRLHRYCDCCLEEALEKAVQECMEFLY